MDFPLNTTWKEIPFTGNFLAQNIDPNVARTTTSATAPAATERGNKLKEGEVLTRLNAKKHWARVEQDFGTLAIQEVTE